MAAADRGIGVGPEQRFAVGRDRDFDTDNKPPRKRFLGLWAGAKVFPPLTNASPHFSPGEVWINQGGYQGGFAGVFALGQAIPDGASLQVALGDLDGDSDQDAVIAGSSVQVWWNNGQAHFSDGPQLLASSGVAAVGDLDGDQAPDVFVARQAAFGPSLVFWNEWSSNNSFRQAEVLSPAGNPFGAGLADFDGDQHTDVFLATSSANEAWWNDGSQTFTAGVPIGNERDQAVALGDLDRDGDIDAFVARRSELGSTSQNGVWLNNGGRRIGVTSAQSTIDRGLMAGAGCRAGPDPCAWSGPGDGITSPRAQ